MNNLIPDVFGVILSYLPCEVAFLVVRRVCHYWHDMVALHTRDVNLVRARLSLLTDAGVLAILIRLPNLQRLKIGAATRLTASGMDRVLSFAIGAVPQDELLAHTNLSKFSATPLLQSLVFLELNIVPRVDLRRLTSLRQLVLEPPVPVAFNTYKTINRTPLEFDHPLLLPSSLHELSLIDSIISTSTWDSLSNLTQLHSLNISESRSMVTDIKHLTSLRELKMNYFGRAGMLSLPSSLRKIDAVCLSQLPLLLLAIKNCPNLEHLNISLAAFDHDNLRTWGSAALKYSLNLPTGVLRNLKALNLSFFALDNEMAQVFAVSFPKLEQLILRGSLVTPTCIRQIEHTCSNLKVTTFTPVEHMYDHDDDFHPHKESAATSSCVNCNARIQSCCIEDHSQICLKAPVACPNAQYGCPTVLPRDLVCRHLSLCSFYYILCQRCSEVVLRSEFSAHASLHDSVKLVSAPPCPVTWNGCPCSWPQSRSHIDTCIHAPVVCHSCQEILPNRQAVRAHNCPETSPRQQFQMFKPDRRH